MQGLLLVKGRVRLSSNSKKKTKIRRNKEKNISYRVSTLHVSIRAYFAYRLLRARKIKAIAPFTLKQLDEQEKDINKLRKELGKQPIRLM